MKKKNILVEITIFIFLLFTAIMAQDVKKLRSEYLQTKDNVRLMMKRMKISYLQLWGRYGKII